MKFWNRVEIFMDGLLEFRSEEEDIRYYIANWNIINRYRNDILIFFLEFGVELIDTVIYEAKDETSRLQCVAMRVISCTTL